MSIPFLAPGPEALTAAPPTGLLATPVAAAAPRGAGVVDADDADDDDEEEDEEEADFVADVEEEVEEDAGAARTGLRSAAGAVWAAGLGAGWVGAASGAPPAGCLAALYTLPCCDLASSRRATAS